MEPTPTIKHIVISGGGGTGLAFYGILKESHKSKFWKLEDIETMHSTSIGTIIMLSMPIIKNIGWESYDDYLIRRPWEKIFNITADKILKSYSNIGVFGREVFELSLQPLLSSVDLSLNTTLKEFHEFSGIEMHWYATNLDNYCLEDISHKTHPNWTVVDATYSSCALPIMFTPAKINGTLYADGGTFCGYPIMQCLKIAASPDEVFGICKNGYNENRFNVKRVEYANLLDYLSDLLVKTIESLEEPKTSTKNVVCIFDEYTSVMQVCNTFKTIESRSAKIKIGEDAWNEFAKTRTLTS
jgi:hypothetical protein